MMPAYLIADSFVSLAAVMGLMVMRRALRENGGRSPLNRRFLFASDVLGVMIFARVLHWFTGVWLFGTLTFLAASLIPLAALLVTEGLMRRHAPRPVKWLILGGTCLLALFAIWPWNGRIVVPLATLAGFQMLVFGVIGYLVVTRDRAALPLTENRIVDRLGLSLLLILPFALSDFRTGGFDTPVRLSGVAILVLCWLVVGLGRSNASHREALRRIAIMLCGCAVTAATVAALATLDLRTSVQVFAIFLSAALVMALYIEARAARRDRSRDSLLTYLATTDWADTDRFLNGLQRTSFAQDAILLSEAELADFDTRFFDAMTAKPVRRRADLSPQSDTPEQEQLRWFFDRFGATHALLIHAAPPRILALNIPPLAASQTAEHELQVAQKVAHLLADQKRGNHD